MKRSIKIAVAAAMALSATSAFATNGDHLIGLGAKARGMGGIGIGMSHGAESALVNPAMITSVKGTEVSFGGTVFMPDVQTNMGAGFSKSDADLSVIPEVSLASKVSDNIWIGVGMWGTAGMGTDYRSAIAPANNVNMVTNLQLMQFGVPVAYKSNGLSIGIAPVLQYGSLDINYDTTGMPAAPGSTGPSTTQGVAQDFGLGYNLGLAYEMGALTLGGSYKSAIDMNYKGQLSKATADFTAMGYLPGAMADNLEQPAEMGVGASFTDQGHTVAVDYKRIKWSDAKGYKDFKWDDQDVIMLGYQYAQDNWALRAGYNHASSPIKEQNPFVPGGAAMNMFNLLGFPAIVEDHYTIGGTYEFSKMTSLDVSYVYADETTETFSMGASNISTKHSQDALSLQVNFAF